MAGSRENISKPLGFMIDPSNQGNLAPPLSGGRPSSPYDTSALPYSPNSTFGPSPTSYNPPMTSGNYNQNSPSSPYGPQGYSPYGPPPSSGNPYGPPPSGGNPYGPPPSGGNKYGPPPSGGYNYGPPPGGNVYPSPQGYPGQSGSYPSQGYPTQQGLHPGTSVVYPGQEKKNDSGLNLGSLATAGAAALAGVAGSTLMGGKHKKKKHGYGYNAGPAALMGGVTSLLGGNKHGHKGSSALPIGGTVAGGAAALAGAYMLSKSPMGKMMKPKKMKKLYKHKGWGSSSSSSSSSD